MDIATLGFEAELDQRWVIANFYNSRWLRREPHHHHWGKAHVMRMVLCLGIFLAFGGTYARASETCEMAYQSLKQFEDEHPVDSEAAMAALRKGDHCSDVVLNFEDQVDANAQAIASYAKAFVEACRNDARKSDDLAFYSLDAVLHPPRSVLRQRCKSGM
jgi:hypothetical protein